MDIKKMKNKMKLRKISRRARGLGYFIVIPMETELDIIGIKNFSIDTFMGQLTGEMKWIVFFSLIFMILSFTIATLFIIRYTKDFYAERAVPSSWKFILWGIFATTIAEAGDLIVFYEWPKAGIIETNLLLIIPHAIGGILIGYGSYLLYKEISD